MIGLLLAVAAALYGYHLATGFMPPRAAVTILGFPIYWYGVWIITGIALGAWVAARLAEERARRVFEATVPAELRQRPLAEIGLPDETAAQLAGRGITTLGEALWRAGLDPRRLMLKKEPTVEAVAKLAAAPGVEAEWLSAAPWRRWNPDHIWNGLMWALILGLIGARLYHILTPSPSMAAVGIYSPLDYLRDPLQLLNFRGGGLGIYGGLAGGALGIYIYARRNRLSMLDLSDLAVVGLALGQAIGRWGNFFNQELYGRPTDLPWAVRIDPIHRLPDYAAFERFHPAFLYESLWSLMTFVVLLWLARRRADRLLPGELTALYLIAYAIGRTLLELVRLDSRAVAFFGLESGLAVATLVSIIIALGAAAAVIIRRRRRRATVG
jgi:phosphatidylglycerol:prolipoprotein diacylglycerol transferase